MESLIIDLRPAVVNTLNPLFDRFRGDAAGDDPV